MLAFQPLALTVDPTIVQPFRIYPDAALPRVAIEPTHWSARDRMLHGGCRVMVEFESQTVDLLRVAQEGMEWIEDVLAALTVSGSYPARHSNPIELLETTDGVESKQFLLFVDAERRAWQSHIGTPDIDFLRGAAIHWRELETGRRLRRAARRYAQALGEPDQLAAFQLAYQGLESLEKPLALERGLTPGTEITAGACATCGSTFERKKSALVGVRALVHGEFHGGKTTERIDEWKRMSKLRSDLVHSLEDPESVADDAENILPATMHYLHDACAHLAHAHDLESARYAMPVAAPRRLVARGEYTGAPSGPLVPLLTPSKASWVQHGGEFVPQFGVERKGGDEVGAFWYTLSKPLAAATEADLVAVDWVKPGDVRPKPGGAPSPRGAVRKQRRAQKSARKKRRERS
jgi:hypothetical protein